MLSWNLTHHLVFFCWPLLPKLEPKSVCILQSLLPFLTMLGMAWVLKIFKIPSTCLNGSINVTKICGITPALFNTLLEWVINGFYMHTGHSKFAMLEIPWWQMIRDKSRFDILRYSTVLSEAACYQHSNCEVWKLIWAIATTFYNISDLSQKSYPTNSDLSSWPLLMHS